MRTPMTGILRVSMVVAMLGVLVALALGTNCGGSSGGTRTSLGGSTGSGQGGSSSQGSGGVTGGGAGGMTVGGTGGVVVNQCPNGGNLDCTMPVTLSDGVVTDFSAQQWSTALGKYCDASGLRGSPFGYPPVTTADGGQMVGGTASVDTAARNLKITVGVGPGGFALGGLSFESCVSAGTFNALQFTAALTGGSLDGCVWQVQLQTQEQRPTSSTSPSGGTCVTSCNAFPAATNLAIPSSTLMTITVPFTDFTSHPAVLPLAGQLVGIQWQVNSGPPPDGSTQTGCNAEIRIDDIKFITQ